MEKNERILYNIYICYLLLPSNNSNFMYFWNILFHLQKTLSILVIHSFRFVIGNFSIFNPFTKVDDINLYLEQMLTIYFGRRNSYMYH